jgi:hypothetical protein
MVEVANRTKSLEVVDWDGLFLPSDVDGAIEEGTPRLLGGGARYTFTRPLINLSSFWLCAISATASSSVCAS